MGLIDADALIIDQITRLFRSDFEIHEGDEVVGLITTQGSTMARMFGGNREFVITEPDGTQVLRLKDVMNFMSRDTYEVLDGADQPLGTLRREFTLFAKRVTFLPADGGDPLEVRTYGHIVVDEAQDLSPMALRVLGRRSLNGSMTIVGDIAQSTGAWAHDDWDEVIEQLPIKRPPRRAELTVDQQAFFVPHVTETSFSDSERASTSSSSTGLVRWRQIAGSTSASIADAPLSGTRGWRQTSTGNDTVTRAANSHSRRLPSSGSASIPNCSR